MMIAQNRAKSVLTLAAVVAVILGLTAVTANATVTISSGDWNTAGNWDGGVPTGTGSAVISDGHSMTVAAAAPTYSGGLTMGDGSSLTINDQGLNIVDAANAIGTGTITMNNSTLDVRTRGTVSFGAIDLVGDGTITANANSADSRVRNLTGVISGTGAFTIFGRNKQPWDWQQTNTFSGGLTLEAIDRHEMKFNAAGAAGTGDVTVNPRTSDGRSAVVIVNVDDVFADTATLTLNGDGWDNSTGGAHPGTNYKIVMNADDTIGGLIVDDVEQPIGEYTDASGDWISGSGTLTVKGIDPNAPGVDAGANWITWSGEPVDPNAVIVEKGLTPWTNLTYFWTAVPSDGVEFDPPLNAGDPNTSAALDPTVTIIKDPGDVVTITLTLAVSGEGKPDSVKDIMTIDVYDDSCQAKIGAGGETAFDPSDFTEDCITNLDDVAVLALRWFVDYALTAPVPK